MASSTGSSRLFGPCNAASLAVQAKTESIWLGIIPHSAGPVGCCLLPLVAPSSSTGGLVCRPASARLTLAAPPEVLADVSQQAARHILMKLSPSPASLACTGPTPGHLDRHPRLRSSHLHKRDPRPFAPAVPPPHTDRRIATTTTHICRASSPTIPLPSPPRRDHARYRYGVHRK